MAMEPGYGFHGSSSSVQGLQSPVFARAPVPRPNRLRGAKNLSGRSVGINRRLFVYYRALAATPSAVFLWQVVCPSVCP